jgi:hypothetical protein
MKEGGSSDRIEVSCYAGYRADERPVRFRLGEVWYSVEEVLDRWYGPESRFFKVRAEDGNLYILRRGRTGWFLVSYRRTDVN